MAGYEHKENSGSLFRNDRKEQDKHPDYKGSCMVNGVVLEMAAWIKESSSGTKFMSIRFSEQRDKPAQSPKKEEKNDDIPF